MTNDGVGETGPRIAAEAREAILLDRAVNWAHCLHALTDPATSAQRRKDAIERLAELNRLSEDEPDGGKQSNPFVTDSAVQALASANIGVHSAFPVNGMDRYQAMSLIGFDGPDAMWPKAEVLAEIRRLEAAPKPHHPTLASHIASLHKLAERATEKGGYRPK